MEPRPHFTEYDTRLAAYAVIVRDRQVLLARYNGLGGGAPGLTLPGGGVEFEESCEAGVLREVTEETGYTVTLDRLLTTHSWSTNPDPGDPSRRPYKSVRVVYEGHVVGGRLGTVEVGGTTDEARWVGLNDVDSQPHADIVEVGIRAWRDQHGHEVADSGASTPAIRVIALDLIRRGDELLVCEGVEGDRVFYRPPGGGVEFGEPAAEAVVRALRELDVELVNVRLRTVMENRVELNGEPGHQVVFLFDADLADVDLLDRGDWGRDRGTDAPVRWMSIAPASSDSNILYPEGLRTVLTAQE